MTSRGIPVLSPMSTNQVKQLGWGPLEANDASIFCFSILLFYKIAENVWNFMYPLAILGKKKGKKKNS